MVLQETWLKAGTIRENIAMGNPDASMAQVEAAARAAHAHSFITRLPEGYDTVIGEDGGLLSQGQKLLLCISRVMLGRGEEARRVKGTGNRKQETGNREQGTGIAGRITLPCRRC